MENLNPGIKEKSRDILELQSYIDSCLEDSILNKLDDCEETLKNACDSTYSYCDCKLLMDVMDIAADIEKISEMTKAVNIYDLDVIDYFFLVRLYKGINRVEGFARSIYVDLEFADVNVCPEKLEIFNRIVSKAWVLDCVCEEYAESFTELRDLVMSYRKAKQKANSAIGSTIMHVVSYVQNLLEDVLDSQRTPIGDLQFIEAEARKYFMYYCDFETEKLKKQTRNLFSSWPPKLETDHWCRMKVTEDKALALAAKGSLQNSKDETLGDYDGGDKFLMDTNSKMIELLLDTYSDDKLFDFNVLYNAKLFPDDNYYSLFDILDYYNIDLFYRLVLRGNIIRCQIYPELQPIFEAWLKGEETVQKAIDNVADKEKKTCAAKCQLSDDDKKRLGEIKGILEKGKWNAPANKENVAEFIEVLYGEKPKLLDKEDIESSDEFRRFFRTGRGSDNFSRLQISTANVIGYLMECGYLDNTPLQLSRDFFGKEGNENNINHGKKDNRSAAFEKLIPFMDKYRLKIIEKHD